MKRSFIDDVKLEWLNRLNRFDLCKRKMDETSIENSTDGNESVESIRKKKRLSVPTLDEVCARFPKLWIEIAEQLDNESMISLKTVSRQMNQVLGEDRSFWLRRIKQLYRINRINEKHLFYDSWKNVVRKTPVEILKEIVNCLEGFFLFFTQKSRPNLCPLHIAVFLGNLQLANHFIEKTKDYCPKNKYGWTPLHFVVLRGRLERYQLTEWFQFRDKEWPIQHLIEKIGFKKVLPRHESYLGDYFRGAREYSKNMTKTCFKMRYTLKADHLEICKIILDKIDTKNPADDEGWTPLHLAAIRGHLDLCQIILERIDYNHLANNDKTFVKWQPVKWTPLHWAIQRGHVDVCRLILSKTNNMNPKFEHGNTLLHLVVDAGEVEVCKLLLQNATDKNPANDDQITPLHQAVLKVRCDPFPCGNDLEICKLLWSNVEDRNAVLNMVNPFNGRTLKEELAYASFHERSEKVFKLFKV